MNDSLIRNIAREEVQRALDSNSNANQFTVANIPFHLHNGSDCNKFPFTNLSDVPVTYYNSAGRTVNVNSTETGLIFGGGTLFDHYTNAGNVTTGETTLYTDTVVGDTLANNGDKLEAEYGGVFVSSGTATREIKVYFGGTVIFDTGALTLSLSSAWTGYVSIIRVSNTVVRYMISFTTEGAALAAYTSVGELTGLNLSNDNIMKITGQAAGAGAATNDIVAKLGSILLVLAA